MRILAIWASCRAVGIDLSPRIYYVMGPLFFLVLLVPFTLNGFAVREAFFVSFLGSVGVDADAAFAAGFLFFLVTVALALPGGVILLWEGIRGAAEAAPCLTSRGVVVTYNALPWIEQCLESVRAPRRSSSTTARPTARSLRARALPATCSCSSGEPRARGRLERGIAAAGRYFLLLNADAWLVGRRARAARRFADEHPEVAVVGPQAAQPRRVAAALGARLPDALAARDRVPLPAQARAGLAAPERVLRRAASTTTRCARSSA